MLRALLAQASYSVRLDRQPMERLDNNPLFLWFVRLSMDAPIWDAPIWDATGAGQLDLIERVNPADGPAVKRDRRLKLVGRPRC